MQGFIILANTGTEKHTLVFYSTSNSDKVTEREYRLRVPGHGACL